MEVFCNSYINAVYSVDPSDQSDFYGDIMYEISNFIYLFKHLEVINNKYYLNANNKIRSYELLHFIIPHCIRYNITITGLYICEFEYKKCHWEEIVKRLLDLKFKISSIKKFYIGHCNKEIIKILKNFEFLEEIYIEDIMYINDKYDDLDIDFSKFSNLKIIKIKNASDFYEGRVEFIRLPKFSKNNYLIDFYFPKYSVLTLNQSIEYEKNNVCCFGIKIYENNVFFSHKIPNLENILLEFLTF